MKTDLKYHNAHPAVSVVLPTRNAATTVMSALKSLLEQTYPICEIFVVDNVSGDTTCALVEQFAKTSRIPITLIRQKRDKAVGSSFNLGVKRAKSEFVVLMMSDCALPSPDELTKLVRPLITDRTVGATYSASVLPMSVWIGYNFWEKFWAARMVENYSSLMVLKFDCVRRSAFLEVGGFDEINFGGDKAIGGEDADLSNRLKKKWRIVPTKARSLHIHYLAQDYSLRDMARSRKLYARSYGRFLRKNAREDIRASIIFFVKPFLAIMPFIPRLTILGLVILVTFSFWYTKIMFLHQSTRLDGRITLVPFINIFFVYYETYWLIQAFLSYKAPIKEEKQ